MTDIERVRKVVDWVIFERIAKNRKDLASIIGYTESSFSQIINSKVALSESFINNLSNADPRINKNWLLTGVGEMLRTETTFKNEVVPVDESEYMMVEYVDLRASAGKLGVGDVKTLPDKRTRLVPKEYATGKFLVVGVDGDSMNDGTARSLNDGDEILIYQQEGGIMDPLPIRKTLFVITSQDGNVLKQITEINREEQYIVCHSFNPAYPDFRIHFDDIFQIFTVCKIVQKQISLI